MTRDTKPTNERCFKIMNLCNYFNLSIHSITFTGAGSGVRRRCRGVGRRSGGRGGCELGGGAGWLPGSYLRGTADRNQGSPSTRDRPRTLRMPLLGNLKHTTKQDQVSYCTNKRTNFPKFVNSLVQLKYTSKKHWPIFWLMIVGNSGHILNIFLIRYSGLFLNNSRQV